MISISFLSKKEASLFLKEPDDFLNSLNEFNFKVYLNNKGSSLKDYLKVLDKCSLDFEKKEIKLINSLVEDINTYWTQLGFPTIKTNLIKTNGLDAFNLPYTRGNSIIFPSYLFKSKNNDVLSKISRGLIVHEIFHILTRINPELKEHLYSFFEFKKREHKTEHQEFIINPDAPFYEWSIPLNNVKNGKKIDGELNLAFKDSQIRTDLVWDLNTQEFIKKTDTNLYSIIKNTKYSIHPEEICAEYFRLIFVLMSKNKDFGRISEIEDQPQLLAFKQKLQNFKF